MKDCSKFPNFKNYFKKNSSTLAAESVKATKLIYTKGQISELKKLWVMQNIEKPKNSKTRKISENLHNFENLLIFKFDNSKIVLKFWQFRKLSNFHNWNFFWI